ncbi:MAG: ArsB/NhaD family transporter [Chloroflexi bacterium]|nr:ArsB/NhaD family transporter [Chloroflexota bacterium]
MILPQVLAGAVFVATFTAISWGRVHRCIPALTGAAVMLVVVFGIVLRDVEAIHSIVNFYQLVEVRFWLPGTEPIQSRGINWQTIFFIAGMMVMVEGLARAGFFRWMCLDVARRMKYRMAPILVGFMFLSGVLSMFIDSITVMLFMASVTVEIARLLEFDPVPVIIAEIIASNTGGSATMSGDPPNIIIGTSFGYTFTDFALNTGPIAVLGLAVSVLYFYLLLRKPLTVIDRRNHRSSRTYPEPRASIRDKRIFILQSWILVLTVALLVMQGITGMSVALIGAVAAGLTLLASNGGARDVLAGVDWRTLLFFIGLFVCVSGLEETGVLSLLARHIGAVSGGDETSVVAIILWGSAFTSALVDNIPFVAGMVPVISSLSQTLGLNQQLLSWALALGTDIGGNGTPIGASANVVGTAISSREGHPIGWGRYLRYALPVTMLVTMLCNAALFVRYLK